MQLCLFSRTVCIDINIRIRDWNYIIHGDWKLGPCSGAHSLSKKRYNGKDTRQMTLYTERCCMAPGRYVLTCKGSPYTLNDNFGWNGKSGGFLEIQGHKYCDDSIIYNSMQVINIVEGE